MSMHLAAFVAATEKQHDGSAIPAEVHAIASYDMHAQLAYAFVDQLAVSKIASLYLTKPDAHTYLGNLVSQRVELFGSRVFSRFFDKL